MIQKFLKYKIQVQMKSKKLRKYSFSTTKMPQFFPFIQSKSSPDSKFVNQFIDRIQSGFITYKLP